MKGVQYSDAKREEVLATLIANGGNIAKTAAEVGLPRSTVISWRNLADAAGQALLPRAEPIIKTDYAALWGRVQEQAAARLSEIIPDSEDVRAVAYAAGIAADKHLDYSQGRKGATTNVNVDARQLTVSNQLSDEDRRQLLDMAREPGPVYDVDPTDHNR